MSKILTDTTLMFEYFVHSGFIIGNAFDIPKMMVDIIIAEMYDVNIISASIFNLVCNSNYFRLPIDLFGQL